MSGVPTSVRNACRPLAWRLAPELMADRAHQHQRELHREMGLYSLAEQLVRNHGDRVLRGPFAGMRYPAERLHSVPKRIGVYESELHPWFKAALLRRPLRFIDIGAADGYYAVGCALKGLPVDAFELAPSARRELRELSVLNSVTVNTLGRAKATRLRAMDLNRALVLSDCEGAEIAIFEEKTVRALSTAIVIIEVHEDIRPGATEILRGRFDQTHICSYTEPHRRTASTLGSDPLDGLSTPERERAVSEMRNGQTPWLMFEPRVGWSKP